MIQNYIVIHDMIYIFKFEELNIMTEKYNPKDIASIINYSKTLENKRLIDVIRESPTIYNIKNKGNLGHIIERDFFGYDINSRREADFIEVNVELKVIPVKEIQKKPNSELYIKRKGLSVKERVVLSIINFNDMIDQSWETTDLHHKLDKILMMFYLYEKDVEPYSLKFLLSELWEPMKEDIPYLKKDWELIKSKIEDGRAHELSEGDTFFLGASTKGASKKSLVSQPNSNHLAMQRAYSLKRSYVDHIFNKLLESKESNSSLALDVYENVITTFQKIQYLSVDELIKKYDLQVNRNAKHFLFMIVSSLFEKLLGITAKEFNDKNVSEIEIKTVLLKRNNIPKESMSFEQISYEEITEGNWETSEFRSKFENKKLLWVVFKTNETYKNQKDLNLRSIILLDAFYWNMPIEDLDGDVKELWIDTVDKIKQCDFENFKKISETKVAHIRPKAKNKNDLSLLSNGLQAPKKSFWLNNQYVGKQIETKLKIKGNLFY